MTYSSQFHMPGSFHAEATGVHPGIFRPPVSPGSSTGFLPTPPTVESKPKRKRHCDSTSQSYFPASVDADFDAFSSASTTSYPRPYLLAGQIGTPSGGPDDNASPGEAMYSETSYRRGLCARRVKDVKENISPEPTSLFDLPTQPRPAPSWGSNAFATIGGVMGRMWDFCTAGAFRGFYAGGGKGYGVDATVTGQDIRMDGDDYNDRDDQRMPGQFPHRGGYDQDAMLEDSDYNAGEYSSRASTPTRPAAKRRQTEDTDDLGRNWVVVTEPSTAEKRSRPRLPNRNHNQSVTTGRRKSTPNSRLASTPNASAQRRPLSRLSTAQPAPRPASSASFASPRSPSPSKIPKPSNTYPPSTTGVAPHISPSQPSLSRRRSTMASTSGSPSFSHRRTNSAASVASHRAPAPDDDGDIDASPRLDAEARKLANRRRNEERDADYRIAAFNKQLQDMIRQGREALGTTIEVDSMDGGWEDEL